MNGQNGIVSKYTSFFRSRKNWIGIGVLGAIGIYAANSGDLSSDGAGNYDDDAAYGYADATDYGDPNGHGNPNGGHPYGGDPNGYGGHPYGGDPNGYGNPGGSGGPSDARATGWDDASSANPNDPWNADGPGGAAGDFHPASSSGSPAARGWTQVTILDNGLRMPRSTMSVPRGWQVHQDIATNPQNGSVARYVLGMQGPNGEITHSTGPKMYIAQMGQSFDQTWREAAMLALQNLVQGAQVGQLQRSRSFEELPTFQEFSRRVRMEAFEAPIRGHRGGQGFAGLAYVVHAPQSGAGIVSIDLVLSPESSAGATIQTYLQIASTTRPNPQFDRAMSQINQRIVAASQRSQGMSMQQQSFAAHQRRMQAQSQMNDQRNAQWMSDFTQSGGGWTGGSGYGSHEAFIDQIHEQQTFNDPYSGQQMQLDGQYDYNYTNGLGDYYRTNDPSFDPNSLSGDWQSTDPLGSNP